MKQFFRPAALLFYLLMLLNFFVLGMYLAKLVGAAENQGLAGGAIVLGYGVVSAFIGLVISFFVAYHLKHPLLIRINIVLTIFLAACIALITYNVQQRKKIREADSTPIERQEPTSPEARGRLLALAAISKKAIA